MDNFFFISDTDNLCPLFLSFNFPKLTSGFIKSTLLFVCLPFLLKETLSFFEIIFDFLCSPIELEFQFMHICG